MGLADLKAEIADLQERLDALRGGIFDVEGKTNRLAALEAESAQPGFWDNPEYAQKLQRERAQLESVVNNFNAELERLEEAGVLIELGLEADDDSVEAEAQGLIEASKVKLAEMELQRMMSGRYDGNDAIIQINPGAGGTDAQDWAEMLLRMYSRWLEQHGFKVEEVERQPGEEAGVASATIIARGPYAYGWLRAENGVHRLVRISPFDSNARRHTAFAAVHVFPELDDELDVDIDWEKDVREDCLRASGAGGQHVNKTESAIRLTHLDSGIVVACQSERSQHKNRANARKILAARLYDKKMQEQRAERDKMSGEKKAIEWGSQIRSYVTQPYRMVKDHRTGHEASNVDAVFDGDLDGFMEAYLLAEGASGDAATTAGAEA